jgi:hypothetical protein
MWPIFGNALHAVLLSVGRVAQPGQVGAGRGIAAGVLCAGGCSDRHHAASLKQQNAADVGSMHTVLQL